METILHVCGRDRNLLGTLAHLLGVARPRRAQPRHHHRRSAEDGRLPRRERGLRPGLHRHPQARARGSNHGVDPGGKPLGATTRFVLATGAEPAALNYPREIARLREKKAAGAELVMTQPVYDPRVLERVPRRLRAAGAAGARGPVAARELPQRGVPAQRGPRDAGARCRARAHAQGGHAARLRARRASRSPARCSAAVRRRVAGAYVMPPLERHELALEVIDGFLDPA